MDFLETEFVEQGGILLIRPNGSIEGYLSDWLDDVEQRVDTQPRNVVLNLSNVDFISSRGMGIIFHLHKKLNSLGCKLHMAELQENVAEAMDIGGITDVIEAFDTEEQALQGLTG
ncbi:MAG: STAS domain-containing protein [Planctomycetes bacterium]|nr:STAS domain-containing protein [Planctomycetota bacterium]